MTESPGVLFERLLDVMARLRGPDGCPWDREQTRTSLKPCLIEEAYEVLEAIAAGNPAELQEELGDLLFQVVFLARLAEEVGEFAMPDLLRRLIDKREAEQTGHPRSVIDGVPRSLPALLRAQRIQTKAARVSFDWPDARSAWAKVEEEIREAAAALASGEVERVQEELGDALFSLVNVARLSSIDAEEALQDAIEKFRHRFAEMEAGLIAQGKSIGAVPQDEMERSWESAKAHERRRAKP